jgi:phosphate starvation-inducible PhoH-like protein
VEGITFTHFTPQDVVRHALVQKIVEAYESHDKGAGDNDPRQRTNSPSPPAGEGKG